MRLVVVTIPVAIVVGYLAGGGLGNLANVRLRWPMSGLAGIALQFAPVAGTGGMLLLVASFLFLFVAAGVNRRLPGFAVILVGLWLNFVVITVNEGMPVTEHALVASGQVNTLADLRSGADTKHHLASNRDQLVFLGDAIPIPPPIHQAVSIGDLLAYSGAMWFVVRGMRRPAPQAADRGIEAEDAQPRPADLSAAEAS
ncbi:MAG: DUF5317 domain-containing protein [Actinomycetota bacterium]